MHFRLYGPGGIPTLMRAFTSTINEINGFTATLAPHWTDVQFIPRDRQNINDPYIQT